MEQVIVSLFAEVRRHKPSVIYIPNIDAWYATLAGTVAFITFQTMLRSIPATDPVLLLATAECEKEELPVGLLQELFSFTCKNRMAVARPERVSVLKKHFLHPFLPWCHACGWSNLVCLYLGLPDEVLFCNA